MKHLELNDIVTYSSLNYRVAEIHNYQLQYKFTDVTLMEPFDFVNDTYMYECIGGGAMVTIENPSIARLSRGISCEYITVKLYILKPQVLRKIPGETYVLGSKS